MSVVCRSWPRIEEFWFDEPLPPQGVDVALLRQRPDVPEHIGARPKHTLIIDLAQDDEALLAAMNADTRRKIRGAQKDGLNFAPPALPDDAAIRQFHAFFVQFAADKGLVPVSLAYLQAAASAGVMFLSSMSHEGEAVVWHTHLVVRRRARLLHSASLFRGQDAARRNLIGRANRLLHWQEMQAFREAGASHYDFGGWYAGSEDQDLLAINRFKEGFGGTPRQESEGLMALSGLGHAYLLARKLKQRFEGRDGSVL